MLTDWLYSSGGGGGGGALTQKKLYMINTFWLTF